MSAFDRVMHAIVPDWHHKPPKPGFGMTSAVIAIALGCVGVEEDEAISTARAVMETYGSKPISEEATREVIRRVQGLRHV